MKCLNYKTNLEKNMSEEKIYLKNKMEVAKFVKYIITDLIDGISQSNMFVYNDIVYTISINEYKYKK